ncbi:MAG: DUF2339 domain-containing protein [Verrucomicrobia bacterium]|nr:DUF2339 domain-containing protein [Verrucomicrobiota bacterium]
MFCPRCHTETDAGFCPNCSLDLNVYAELAEVRRQISELRRSVEQIAGRDHSSTQPAPLPAKRASWFRSRPAQVVPKPKKARSSTEVAVGQKWFLGIGVFVLLLAAGFFLKYAFDENWIGPAAQVTLGFLAGASCFVAGEVCRRRKLRGLDIALAAVGLGVLYLSIYAANQIYGLIPDLLTILLVLLVSAVGLAIASVWDSRLVAILAFLGGYLAPVLDTSDRSDHRLFFGCLAIINIASEGVAYLKRWTQLYFLGALFSWILLLIFWGNIRSESFLDAFVFTQFLFLLYSIVPFLRSFLPNNLDHIPVTWLSALNGWLCVWKSGDLLHWEKSPLALVALVYGTTALSLALLYWRHRTPSTVLTWLLAQAGIYFLVAWAVIFSGHWTTFFWALQCVGGYWVANKARDRILTTGTILLGLIVVFRFLILDLGFVVGVFDQTLSAGRFTDGLLERWAIGLPICLSFLAVAWLAAKVKDSPLDRTVFHWFETMGLIALFGLFNVELDRVTWQFFQRAQLSAYSILWAACAAVLLVAGFVWNRKFYRISAILLLFVTVAKVLLLDTAEVLAPYRILSCTVLGGVLIVLSAVYYRLAPRLLGPTSPAGHPDTAQETET